MRGILIMCAAILVLALGYLGWRFSQPDHHGRAFTGARETQIGEIATNPAGFTNGEFRIKGKIVRQCPASGCWFFLEDGNRKQLRVEMGDVTPQLPQNIGSFATVEGRIVKVGDEYQFAGEGVEFSKR
ncbi:MAG: hypothetical protein PHR77_09075 [Kiritimatiellae bacterium]|nr:hypothetical protein [Kiritimatiellia bacterium]MDD5519371.1 hypothetical protein [Kiritimatiellia bacterium]